VLNSALSGLQLAIGLAFGSLALIGDAVHNLGDVAGLLLGWGAERLSTRPATPRFTYGFGRSTQLASLVNAVLILMAAAVVIVEALQRLRDPVPVVSGPVAIAASAGIVVNLLSARLFGHDHSHDLNRRAAVVHLLTDAAVSAAVLVSALLVRLTGWNVLDSLTAIGVGLAVAASGWSLLRQSLAIALDAVPDGIDSQEVEAVLRALPGVTDVHHLHIWAMRTPSLPMCAAAPRRWTTWRCCTRPKAAWPDSESPIPPSSLSPRSEGCPALDLSPPPPPPAPAAAGQRWRTAGDPLRRLRSARLGRGFAPEEKSGVAKTPGDSPAGSRPLGGAPRSP
jgi:cobalt-zinc-cadmium efflux system protein